MPIQTELHLGNTYLDKARDLGKPFGIYIIQKAGKFLVYRNRIFLSSHKRPDLALNKLKSYI